MSSQGHKHSTSASQNVKAQLANAYNELGKELSSHKLRVVGNYTLGKVIGEGTYGKVRMGTHRLTSMRVAIKQIPKAMSATLTREIHHHRRLYHPHIMQLYEIIATESSIWLVAELCSGGELFDYLVEKGRLNEQEARVVFGQLCLAVGHIHERGIVHRDLKLENVLLDEHCRVKLGDFGFTREYEKGSFLETFCGTTGYAAPEMLQGKRYLGPEVDVWSLGVILYCLLTGTLPFDDDDEILMREKIISSSFEDPEWLSADARDLIRNILQKDPIHRIGISQVLAHPWFKNPNLAANASEISLPHPTALPIPPPSELHAISPVDPGNASHSSITSESSFHSASSEFSHSAPTTPDEGARAGADDLPLHHSASESTLKKNAPPPSLSDLLEGPKSLQTPRYQMDGRPETVIEEDDVFTAPVFSSRDPSPVPRPLSALNASPATSRPPSSFPTRTPVRTKRRSVSSILSQPSSPVSDGAPAVPPKDFSLLLTTPAPLLFSTPLERSLLTNLSNMGFDTAQIVHSVLSNACDSSGAVWWMLKRKGEKKALEDVLKKGKAAAVVVETDVEGDATAEPDGAIPAPVFDSPVAMRSPDEAHDLPVVQMPPHLAFVPATPTASTSHRPMTPPRPQSPTRNLLFATPTASESGHLKSSPSSPAGSMRDKDKDKDSTRSKREGKQRAGSVSIMQRATTALEAAGLVRKKSQEAVRDEKERKEEKEEKDKHGSVPNRLTKTPPVKPVPAKENDVPSTPVQETAKSSLTTASPWVMPIAINTAKAAPTPANSPGDSLASVSATDSTGKVGGGTRNRGSLLSTFRMWFHEDRRGKRKAAPPLAQSGMPNLKHPGAIPATPNNTRNQRVTVKKRNSGSRGNFTRHTAKRASVSSRRSSSVNSRRSSAASMQVQIIESPQIERVDPMINITRKRSDPISRSFTPNSERGDYPSRPSSIHSLSQRQRHRKSPSTSSAGSAHMRRAASPLQKYHRRGGSGSSTRVVRQTKPATTSTSRTWHVRSNSATSSMHSLPSSRPASYYEISEGEGPSTTPLQSAHSRRSFEETPKRTTYNTVLVAHKKQTPFSSPLSTSHSAASFGRSSWKKAWGIEPPGWQSRSAQPVEVLVISSGDSHTNIRDVFTGRQSLNIGDDDEWVDEEDDTPAFAGGLGQQPTSLNPNAPHGHGIKPNPEGPLTLSLPPQGRSGRKGKWVNRNADSHTLVPPSAGRSGGRSKSGHSPNTTTSPLPNESNMFEVPSGRRQLPAARSGPAFRHPIQEEDEDEE